MNRLENRISRLEQKTVDGDVTIKVVIVDEDADTLSPERQRELYGSSNVVRVKIT